MKSPILLGIGVALVALSFGGVATANAAETTDVTVSSTTECVPTTEHIWYTWTGGPIPEGESPPVESEYWNENSGNPNSEVHKWENHPYDENGQAVPYQTGPPGNANWFKWEHVTTECPVDPPVEPGVPTHPIVIPPVEPIEPPVEPGVPTHPIVIPPVEPIDPPVEPIDPPVEPVEPPVVPVEPPVVTPPVEVPVVTPPVETPEDTTAGTDEATLPHTGAGTAVLLGSAAVLTAAGVGMTALSRRRN